MTSDFLGDDSEHRIRGLDQTTIELGGGDMQFGASGEGGGGGNIQTVLPAGPELLFGALMFALVIAAIVAIVFLLVKRLPSSQDDELDRWRERALRAEAQRDLLLEQATEDSNESAR